VAVTFPITGSVIDPRRGRGIVAIALIWLGPFLTHVPTALKSPTLNPLRQPEQLPEEYRMFQAPPLGP